MGHILLGVLPRTRRWREVVELLQTAPEDTPGVAAATVIAADKRLRQLRADPSLTYCFWLLTRVAWASRGTTFKEDLGSLGITAAPETSILGFVSAVTEHVRSETAGHTDSGHFGELASLALRRALNDTVGQHGRSLFGSSVEDLQEAFRAHSTQHQFGSLARRFFADFLARILRSALERELPRQVGSTTMPGITDARDFSQALDLYARQSARIVEDFAGGWYAKNNWESKGQISQEDARGFIEVALRKLRMELKLGVA